MPHFYFHVANGAGFVRDEEGRVLADVPSARAEAISDIRSMLSEEVKRGVLDLRGRVDIVGASGDVVVSIPFADAVELRLGDAAATAGRESRGGS